MKPFDFSHAATGDLIAIGEYLEGESGDPRLGHRFLHAVNSTLKVIEAFPSSGRVRPTRHPRLALLRSLGINSPFNKYLIFYQPMPSVTLILRVLHGAQDLHLMLDINHGRDA